MSDELFFKKLEDEGLLVNDIGSDGWAFWPINKDGKYTGFLNEFYLRKLADEIERRNKPFWDEYEAYCAKQHHHHDSTFEEVFHAVPCPVPE
jgi:hypothetical protein